MRDWKKYSRIMTSITSGDLKPTYEGLKDGLHVRCMVWSVANLKPTYEGLKVFTGASAFVQYFIFKAYLWGIERYFMSLLDDIAEVFKAYLWGIERHYLF